MSKKKNTVIEELDPETVAGFTEAQIRNYRELGYLPYLMSNGKVKWLTAGQKVKRDSEKVSYFAKFGRKPKPPKSKRHKRMRRSNWKTFLAENWKFFALVALVAIALLVVLRNWYTLF